MSTLNTALWYTARGTGVVTLVFFTGVVLLGILTRSGRTIPGLSRWVTSGFHRNLSLLSLVFLIVHIATSIIDPYAGIKLVDAFVPFVSSYRPIWLGLGAISFDLVLALIITSLLRARMPLKVWRGIHWLAYAMWPFAVVHGLGTGTDSSKPWMVGITATCVALVVMAAIWRIVVVSGRDMGTKLVAAGAVVLAPMMVTAWAVAGPLAPHWAKRAGTPTSALASGRTTKKSTTTPLDKTASVKPLALRGSADVKGTITTLQQSGGNVAIVLDGRMSNGNAGQFRVVLRGQPNGGGGIVLSDGTAYAAPSAGGLWQGPVDSLQGGSVGASLTGPSGSVTMSANLNINDAQTSFSGTVTFS